MFLPCHYRKLDLLQLLGMLRAETLKTNSRLMELPGQRFRLRPVRSYNPKDTDSFGTLYQVNSTAMYSPPNELTDNAYHHAALPAPAAVLSAVSSTTVATASTSRTTSKSSRTSTPRHRAPLVTKRKYTRKPKTVTKAVSAAFTDCGDISSPSPNFLNTSTTGSSGGSGKASAKGIHRNFEHSVSPERASRSSISPVRHHRRPRRLQPLHHQIEQHLTPTAKLELFEHAPLEMMPHTQSVINRNDVSNSVAEADVIQNSTARRSYRARKPKLHRHASSELDAATTAYGEEKPPVAKKSKAAKKSTAKAGGKKKRLAAAADEQSNEPQDNLFVEALLMLDDEEYDDEHNNLNDNENDEANYDEDDDDVDENGKKKKQRRPGWQRGRPRKIAPMLERLRRHTLAGRGYVSSPVPKPGAVPLFTHLSDYELKTRNYYFGKHRKGRNFGDQQTARYDETLSYQNRVRQVARETICPLLSVPDWVCGTVHWWNARHVLQYFHALGYEPIVAALSRYPVSGFRRASFYSEKF